MGQGNFAKTTWQGAEEFEMSEQGAFGNEAAFNSGEVIYGPGYNPQTVLSFQQHVTADPGADGYAGFLAYTLIDEPTNSLRLYGNIDSEINIASGNAKNYATVTGIYSQVEHSGSGTVNLMVGEQLAVIHDGLGVVTEARGLDVDVDGGDVAGTPAVLGIGIKVNAHHSVANKAIQIVAGDLSIEVDNGLAFVNQTSAAAAQAGTLLNAPTAGNPFWVRCKKAGLNFAFPIWAVP